MEFPKAAHYALTAFPQKEGYSVRYDKKQHAIMVELDLHINQFISVHVLEGMNNGIAMSHAKRNMLFALKDEINRRIENMYHEKTIFPPMYIPGEPMELGPSSDKPETA